MKCLILASGFGTRLYPLTIDKPKAHLEYKGVPLINHIVNKIPVDVGMVVTTNKKFEPDFCRWMSALKRQISLCVEPVLTPEQSLGAIGSLNYAITENRIEDDLMVVAADNYFEFSLSKFISAFDGRTTLVAVYDIGDRSKAAEYGVVRLDGNKVVEFEEKPKSPKSSLVATACWILPARILPLVSEFASHGRKDNLGDFITHLVKIDSVCAYVFDELWLDIGSAEVYYNTR
ncbi:MAG: hypothetical protein FJ008_07480 [Chloroflexi bacterium]|nr:hypothetical protein [Chloroflexota bacterium]MBM3175721.1 hypothetical protein [Chloroflexota bacterium]MBM4450469.1 hypothetical protein [Chloroflexota bacterium]